MWVLTSGPWDARVILLVVELKEYSLTCGKVKSLTNFEVFEQTELRTCFKSQIAELFSLFQEALTG